MSAPVDAGDSRVDNPHLQLCPHCDRTFCGECARLEREIVELNHSGLGQLAEGRREVLWRHQREWHVKGNA